EDQRPAAEAGEERQDAPDRIVEEVSAQEGGASPQERAAGGVEEETGEAGTRSAGQRRRHGGKAGDELREEKRRKPPTIEEPIRLPHARVGGQRNLAEELQNSPSIPAAEVEPD